MNNPLIFTDPSGYMPNWVQDEYDHYYRNGGGGTGFDYFGWINRSMSSVCWTDNTGPSRADYDYWAANIKGNFLLGKASESLGYWYTNRNSISINGSDALSLALNFYYNNNDGNDYWSVSSLGKINFGKTKLSDLIQQYQDIVLTASTGPLPFPSNAVSVWSKAVAKYLRNTLFLAPGLINPFFRAEAIMSDVGLTFLSEFDVGGLFSLAGKDIGSIRTYHEVGIGFSVDGSLGTEMARVDYSGKASNFNLDLLTGARIKIFGSGQLFGISFGGSFARGRITGSNETISISGVSLGIGATLFGGLNGLGGGGNWGMTYVH